MFQQLKSMFIINSIMNKQYYRVVRYHSWRFVTKKSTIPCLCTMKTPKHPLLRGLRYVALCNAIIFY